MAQFPSTTSASGIWSLKKQKRAEQGDNWPSMAVLVDYLVFAGGGGGGGGYSGAFLSGNSGGSGVVIIRYPNTFPDAVATTGSPTLTNNGTYKIYRWTGSGSITF